MTQTLISFLKPYSLQGIMGGAGLICFNQLTSTLTQNSAMLISLGVAGISYAIAIYFMKIPDVEIMLKAVKKRLGLNS